MARLVTLSIALLAALSLSILTVSPASAQNNDVFIDAPLLINSTIYQNADVFVGRNNTSPFTVTIADGTDIDGDGEEDSEYYKGGYITTTGLIAFNQSTIDMTGGAIAYLQTMDTSIANISGGIVSDLFPHHNSTVNVTGGTLYYVRTFNKSQTNIAGGTHYGYIYSADQSKMIISGGVINANLTASDASNLSIQGGDFQRWIYADDKSTLSISGGNIANDVHTDLTEFGKSKIIISGGTFAPDKTVYTIANGTTQFNGTGLSVTTTTPGTLLGGGPFYGHNYTGSFFTLIGTLSDGTSLNTTVFASDFTGDGNSLVFEGATAASTLFLTENASVEDVTDYIHVGINSNPPTMNTSPTVEIRTGANTNEINVYNQSTLNVQDGTVYRLVGRQDSTLNISGGIIGGENRAGGGWYIGSTYLLENAVANVTGGMLKNGFHINGNSIANISGGEFSGIELNDYGIGNIAGGTVNGRFEAFDHSVVNISGGTQKSSVAARDSSTVNITGGTKLRAFGTDQATVNVSGGTDNSASIFGNGRLNVTGGSKHFVSSWDNSRLNVTGGEKIGIQGNDDSMVNIVGGDVRFLTSLDSNTANILNGTVKSVNVQGTATVNIAGGDVDYTTSFDSGTINVIGGNIGGIDGNRLDSNYIGVYLVSGTLNLYGSNFTRNDITNGGYANTAGTYSTLTGTLLDGSALNTTFFLADGVTYEDLGGGTQDNPLLPDSNNDGLFTFSGVPSGAWFDPPSVDSFVFTMTGPELFTQILDFPTGFDGLFTVSVNGNVLGQFGAGQAVDFAAFGFTDGVSAFTISGINPLVDAENPQGFPIKLGFNSIFASFTMQGAGVSAAPEPGTLFLLLVGVGAWGVCAARRRGARRFPAAVGCACSRKGHSPHA